MKTRLYKLTMLTDLAFEDCYFLGADINDKNVMYALEYLTSEYARFIKRRIKLTGRYVHHVKNLSVVKIEKF